MNDELKCEINSSCMCYGHKTRAEIGSYCNLVLNDEVKF